MTARRASAVALAALALLGGPLHAQVARAGLNEVDRLRQAAAAEARGDLRASEAIYRDVLDARPLSLNALLGYERVLRMQGRLDAAIPAIERFLAADGPPAVGYQILLRTLSDLNQVDRLEEVGGEWIAAMPGIETPYRELARIWNARGQPERAIAILRQGRARTGPGGALAMELGDAYLAAGDLELAVREWEHAIGPDARGMNLVRRRMAAMPDGGGRVLPRLVDALVAAPTTPPRRRAAVELAIDAGLGRRAVEIGQDLVEELRGAEREAFLLEVARRADGAGLDATAYWAYSTLLAVGGAVGDMLPVRSRTAELALAAGDTARARSLYRELERAFAVGSAGRREAAARRIELMAHEGRIDAAVQDFGRFREEFTDAPELDALAAALAGGLMRDGDLEGAAGLVKGLTGPHTHLVRAWLALYQGDIAEARAAFIAAAPGLRGAEATKTIALASLLGRLSESSAKVLGRALARAGSEDVGEALRILTDESGALPGAERAAMLEFAADMAESARLGEEADRIRRALLADHPRASEAPAALLALARAAAGRDGGRAEARALLEELIVEHPRSALVPQARRELARLQSESAGSLP